MTEREETIFLGLKTWDLCKTLKYTETLVSVDRFEQVKTLTKAKPRGNLKYQCFNQC